MSDETPNYDAGSINKLVMPAIEEVGERWRSRWELKFAACPTDEALAEASESISRTCFADVELQLEGSQVALTLITKDHPLDVDTYESVDCVLRALDSTFTISTINESPRDRWRTFRMKPDES